MNRKLLSIAMDRFKSIKVPANNNLNLYVKGFEDSFQYFNEFYNEKLQEEIKRLETFPVMNERRNAIIEMKKVLDQLVKDMKNV